MIQQAGVLANIARQTISPMINAQNGDGSPVQRRARGPAAAQTLRRSSGAVPPRRRGHDRTARRGDDHRRAGQHRDRREPGARFRPGGRPGHRTRRRVMTPAATRVHVGRGAGADGSCGRPDRRSRGCRAGDQRPGRDGRRGSTRSSASSSTRSSASTHMAAEFARTDRRGRRHRRARDLRDVRDERPAPRAAGPGDDRDPRCQGTDRPEAPRAPPRGRGARPGPPATSTRPRTGIATRIAMPTGRPGSRRSPGRSPRAAIACLPTMPRSGQEERALWTEMETLRQYAYLVRALDEGLERRIGVLAGSDPDREPGPSGRTSSSRSVNGSRTS